MLGVRQVAPQPLRLLLLRLHKPQPQLAQQQALQLAQLLVDQWVHSSQWLQQTHQSQLAQPQLHLSVVDQQCHQQHQRRRPVCLSAKA
jgi:hypothetical protein